MNPSPNKYSFCEDILILSHLSLYRFQDYYTVDKQDDLNDAQ